MRNRKIGASVLVALASAGILVVGAAAHGQRTKTASKAATATYAGDSWAASGGDLANTRYSTLTQITTANASTLTPAWTTPINPGFKSGPVESPPIVSGTTMYASSSRGAPAAIDTTSGKELWVTDPSTVAVAAPSRGLAASGNGRGEAIGDGLIFEGQGDGTITAFNQNTGAVVWKTLINTAGVPTYAPATPVYYDGLVYTSLSGNEFGTLRGAIYAYNALTGSLVWTWYAVPFAGQPGADTWSNAKELAGGGGGNWTYGAVDPTSGLLFEGTGNPAPDFGGRGKGANLYTDSMVALNLKTGKLKWYFQAVHHDQWDYDCTSPPVLWNHAIGGKTVQGIDVGCKSGYVYELNRLTGKPVTPVIESPSPNAKTVGKKTLEEDRTWSKTQPVPVGGSVVPHCATAKDVPGPAPNGKPYQYSCTFALFGTDAYTVMTPSDGGAINYEPSSFSPATGDVYVCAQVTYQAIQVQPGAPSPLGAIAPTFANQSWGPIPAATATTHTLVGTLTALNVNNNKTVWQKQYYSDQGGAACETGSSVTAGGLVFVANNGVFLAYNAKTGAQVWSYKPPQGAIVNSAPAIYSANGKEYVAWNADLGTAVNGGAQAQDEIIAFALPS
jgi:quinohemoprotein ethanol dehydrogenase